MPSNEKAVAGGWRSHGGLGFHARSLARPGAGRAGQPGNGIKTNYPYQLHNTPAYPGLHVAIVTHLLERYEGSLFARKIY